MIDLYGWSNAAIIALFLLVAVPAAVLAHLAGARLFGRPPPERHAAALEAFKLIGPLTGIFLTFSLVQSMGQFRSSDAAADREAANIVQLDRALAVFGAESGMASRLLLRDYARALVEDEWPALRHGRGGSKEATAAFARLAASVESMLLAHTGTRFEVTRALDDVHDNRASRIGTATGGLPVIFWWITGCLFVLLICAMSCLDADRHWRILPGLYIAALTLLAALFYIIDSPYKGEQSISPRPLQTAVEVLDARLR